MLSGLTLVQISAGWQSNCSLASTGAVYCWGDDSFGELGNNSTASSEVPVAVSTSGVLSGVTLLQWSRSGTSATSCTITGLTDGTSYSITVPTTATISGTSAPSIAATGTPVGLEATFPTSLTWSSTDNGLNQSIVDSVSGDQQLTVIDSTGSGAGWHITMSATTFTAGSRMLPNSGAMDVNGSVTSSLTGVAPSAACVSSCTLPANTTTYPVALTTAATSPPSYTIYDTSASTGIGAVIIGGSTASHPVGWWVNLPATAYAGSYTSTISFTLVSGP